MTMNTTVCDKCNSGVCFFLESSNSLKCFNPSSTTTTTSAPTTPGSGSTTPATEPKVCGENSFTCSYDDEIQCIPKLWVCDGERDCLNGSGRTTSSRTRTLIRFIT